MSNLRKTLAGLLGCASGIALLANVASATPAMHALAIKTAAPNAVETVRWGGWHGGWGGWHGGWHRGWGWGGFAAGAVIGGALAAPYYYGGYYPYGAYYSPPYPYPAAGYYGGPPGYGGPAGGDASAYCAQRYKSYDPGTGTFLGYDGARHPCP
jgi:hypothetical protein